MSTETQQKTGPPQIFKSNKALKFGIRLAQGLKWKIATKLPNARTSFHQLGRCIHIEAEQWVDNMTKAAEDEPTEVEPEARPSRLGLGAKVSHQSKIGYLNDPVERKLQARLNAGKRNAAKKAESSLSTRDGHGDDEEDEDEDEDLDSRTSTFAKKRPVPPTSSSQSSKKQK